MKAINKKVLSGAIAAAVVFSGAGLVHNQVFAAESAATDKAQAATEQSAHPKARQGGDFRGQQGKGDHGGKQGQFGSRGGNLVKETATALGLEESAVQALVKEGQTLSQIAVANGLTEADFLAKLVAEQSAALDASVTAGKLTQEQADAQKTKLSERVQQQITTTGKQGLKDGSAVRPDKFHGGGFVSPDKLAEIIGITVDDLKTLQESGKSLAEIAEVSGITEDQLIAKIKDSMTDGLKTFVERKGAAGQHGGKQGRGQAPAEAADDQAEGTVLQ